MNRLAKRLSRVTPQITIGLLVFAIALTALLAYRANEAARAHRSTVEQTLREYASFAAFELKNATLARMVSQHRVALDLVLRWMATHGTSPALDVDRVAALIEAQRPQCPALRGVRFYYRVTFGDSAIRASSSPLATTDHLARMRDTIVAHAFSADRADGLAVRGDSARSALGVPLTSNYYVAIFSRLGDTPVVFAHSLTLDPFGRPLLAYGFATDPEPFVEEAVRGVLASQPLLPKTLMRGLPIDSLLSVRVTDGSSHRLFQGGSALDGRYAVTDALEPRYGGLRFTVAVNPGAADRLIIGGVPRSRLPVLVGLFALASGLLLLMVFHLRRQQELVQLRTEFVSGVSHELRTPLTQIRLLAELLRLGKIPTEERRQRSLRIIDQEARRLTFLVEGILSFSRLERDALVAVPTDVGAEIEEIISGFESLASAHQVRLAAHLQPGLRANVDRAALRQVLLNLLDNAVRYGPEGQTVAVTTTARNGTWRLVVEDEGRGIPEPERDRIFEPYYRMERDTRSATGGSGIGLAVVRGLVEKHGGTVVVSDGDRGGSRFTVQLPIAVPKEDSST